ncbi:MAG: SynChlorMet cassette radical SAM/SPASM protein ScmF [Thermodesulfobacteriota bacterium]|nr:SynChlorMet cassette radical SAM/SPASM protein ScmF [Thermodesulfobacteriota bacterium]
MPQKTTQKYGKYEYPLNQIYFYLTEGCNLACRHCWQAPRYEESGEQYPKLPVELFEETILEAIPLGLSSVRLTGGEPLIHARFFDLLKIVRREGLSLNIETNGINCTPRVAAEIKKSPNRFVCVSIDGADAATHDWVRGVTGSFKLAKQAVQNLVACETRPQIIMSIMRHNADQVDALVRMAEDLGASSVKFNIVQPIARGKMLQQAGDTLNIADLVRLGRHVDQELAPNTTLRLIFDYPMAFRPLSRIGAGDVNNSCNILGILGVIASGHYALCGIGNHVPELVFGKIGKDRLKDIWEKDSTLTTLRRGLPDNLEGICARCLMKYQCLGSCIAQNFYRTGRLWAPFWFCESAHTEALFPNTRLM